MKFKISLAILAFHLILQHPIFGQSYLGINFGIVQSNLDISVNDFKEYSPKFKTGFCTSLSLRTYVTKRLSLEFDAQYAALGSNIQVGSRQQDILRLNFNYFSIPVSLYFDVFQQEKITLNLHSGIAPGLMVSGEIIDDADTEKLGPGEDIFSLDAFWQSGAGLQFMPSDKVALRADVNYVKGLLNVNLDEDSDNQELLIKNKALFFNLGVAVKL
jgi:hypothetical protein